MSRLGIGLVGCGGMAHSVHLPAIAALKDRLELVAVCDRDLARAEVAAGEYGGRAYSDLDKMLAEARGLDIVAVVVHAQHHHSVAIRAAEAGKHVIVEKPLALTVPCADAMLDACKRNNVKLEVAENYFRMPMDALINQAARSGVLGPTRTVHVLDPVNGCSLDIGVHRYSQLREAAGGWPTSITAYSSPPPIPECQRPEGAEAWLEEREFGDWRGREWSVAMVTFDNGVLGKCEHFPLGREAPVWCGNLRMIVGDAGAICDDLWPNVWPWLPRGRVTTKRWGGHTGHQEIPIRRTEETLFGKPFAVRIELGSTPPVVWENPVADVLRRSARGTVKETGHENKATWPDWFVAELTAYHTFANAVMEDAAQQYGGPKGRNDVELTIATYESARTGTAITLPLESITEHEEAIHEAFERRYGRPIL
ncbi:MAG TPA: Gfo/Idh/MocA family oxidoreductase [Candidatus Hydrogenedentes bacterium]|nr:Gfo/Idh/MocA family oxidoreductase [Candidatus Hydrogenedentota bacterium]